MKLEAFLDEEFALSKAGVVGVIIIVFIAIKSLDVWSYLNLLRTRPPKENEINLIIVVPLYKFF